MKKLLLFVIIFSLFFLTPQKAQAIQFTSGDDITLNSSSGYKGSQAIFGKKLIISSPIDGDLICAGQEVEITASITGDVICAAQSFKLSGKVRGDVRVAGQDVEINSQVDKNVNIFSQSVALGSSAKIIGELDYASQTDIKIATSATASQITKLKTPEDHKDPQLQRKVSNTLMNVGRVVSTTILALLGLVVLWLSPNWLKKNREMLSKNPSQSLLWGVLVLSLTPIVILMLFVTIIGIPLALLLIPILILAISLAHVVVAAWIGDRLISSKTNPIGSWLLGYLILVVLGLTPVIGFFVQLFATLTGLGAIKLSLFHSKKK